MTLVCALLQNCCTGPATGSYPALKVYWIIITSWCSPFATLSTGLPSIILSVKTVPDTATQRETDG